MNSEDKQFDPLDLENKYSNFIALKVMFNPKIDLDYKLTNSYMMANKDLTEIKILEYSSDKSQKMKNITPKQAIEMANRHYFPQIIKEWGLDKLVEKGNQTKPQFKLKEKSIKKDLER